MITNTNRNHPAVAIVPATGSNESDTSAPVTDHQPSAARSGEDDSSFHKAMVTTATTVEFDDDDVRETKNARADNNQFTNSPESTLLKQHIQNDEDSDKVRRLHYHHQQHQQQQLQQQQQQLINEASEQSNTSTVASLASVLTPQGAVIRQRQQEESVHRTSQQSHHFPKQIETVRESTCLSRIDRRQLRTMQSVTQSMIRIIREMASPSTTTSIPALTTTITTSSFKAHQQQHPPLIEWHQNNDIVTQTVPLFQSSFMSSFNATIVSSDNLTALQQLYIDLQRHSYDMTMIGAATISDSTTHSHIILDQWTTTVCRGITSPDVNATATHALLSALHTLIETDDNYIFQYCYSEQIINAVIHCVFEETRMSTIDNTTIQSSNSQRNTSDHNNIGEKKGATITTTPMPMSSTPTTHTVSSRRRASTMSIPAPSGSSDRDTTPVRNLPPRQSSFYESRALLGPPPMNNMATTTVDEIAVYKLLQLIFILIQKWNVQGMEHELNLTGLLDVCWHVHCKTQQTSATSRLLQQMAMDTEAHIIRSILLHRCSKTKVVVISHVLSRVSDQLLQMNQSIAATSNIKSSLSTASSTTIQDASSRDAPLDEMHRSLINTTNCLAVITLIVRMMDIDFFTSAADITCAEESSSPNVNVLLREAIRSVITVAMYSNHAATLQSCIQIVDEFLAVVGLASLKCEFEVFIHTVLLRRLMCTDATDIKPITIAEKEIVVEYLQAICASTHTATSSATVSILDLYINYDCDCMCSNVFETMMSTISKIACPAKWTELDVNMATTCSWTGQCDSDTSIHVIHRVSTGVEISAAPSKSTHTNITSNIYLHRMALNCILLALNSSEQIANQNNHVVATGSSCSGTEACDELKIQTKKAKKRSLDKVVRSFNTTNPDRGEWLNVAVKEGILDSPEDSVAAAKILFMAPMNIDKQRVGIYLSRGPESDFPFQALLRTHFAALFDFRNMSFPMSLRKFLSKFRLPGEAQCIDRLMEVFSKEYFEQHKEATIFQNADAVFVLAFSTIMLNTDLHNPTIKADRRMTLEEFLRNNRGINSGDNLPDDYLSYLYEQIKERELQLVAEVDRFPTNNVGDVDLSIYWTENYDQKGVPVTDATIRLAEDSRNIGCKALSKDLLVESMLLYVPTLVGIFVTSTDDMIIARVLRAIKQIMQLASEFKMDCAINDVLQTFFALGQEYISKHSGEDGSLNFSSSVDHPRRKRNVSIDSVSMTDDILLGIKRHQIPYGLLCSCIDDEDKNDFVGSSEHRGLLALDCCFLFITNNTSLVKEAWPALIKCLCMLRDIHALPKSLSDLDDFADSNGNVLPLSSFALESQKRIEDHRATNDKENPKQKGWFRSFFRKSKIDDQVSDVDVNKSPELEISSIAKALLGIAESSGIENIVQMGSSKLPDTSISALLEILDQYPFEHDPVGEQHAIFTVELATRALLSQHERAETSFLTFLSKFETLLCKATTVEGDIPDAPFIIERIVVTILRCCIHLYEYPKLRPHLRASLQLLTMTLPRSFIHVISNRMSCGLAIILRASYQHFEDQQEWSFMNDMLDALAHYETSRVFVFDGIASTVEHAIPNFNPNSNVPSSNYYVVDATSLAIIVHDEDDKRRPPPCLSIEACNVLSRILIRFVLNYYHGDQSLIVPAMLCIEKVYRRKVEILLKQQQQQQQQQQNQVELTDDSSTIVPIPTTPSPSAATGIDIVSNAPDPELWQNVAVAIYSVCRSPDPDASTTATKCFRRIVVRTSIDQIECSVWVTMLYLMVHKQPTVRSEVSRANTFSILGQLMLRIVPTLSHHAEYRDDMEEFVLQFAALAEENIQSSLESNTNNDNRECNEHNHLCLFNHENRGTTTTRIMLDKTVQTLTYVCNHILSDGWNGDREFSVWMNEALLTPLELASHMSNSASDRGHGKVVVTTFDNQDEADDVSEISDSVAGEEY